MANEFVVEDGTAFYGRTFEEYRRMFDLEFEQLLGGPVLDCPGGPSSFAAVANAIGADATAADPSYGPPTDRVAQRCEAAIEDVESQLREKRDRFVWEEYGDVDTRIRYARAAATRFLADYARRPERYVDAALPELPFETGAFERVLSANLLFLYDDRFDRDFHVRSLRELARVASGEVRVHGLQNLAAEPSGYVEPAVTALREDGLTVERRSVSYRFQPGPTELLVVTDVAGYEP